MGLYLENVTAAVIGAAMQVHSRLGPGLLERIYQLCLLQNLRRAGFKVDIEVAVPIVYDDLVLDGGLRLDMLVENDVVVELKAVEMLTRLHHAQLLSYLRLANKPVGLLINFNVRNLRDGIRRIMN